MFQQFLSSAEFSDVKLTVHSPGLDHNFPLLLHRVVLSRHSLFFYRLFTASLSTEHTVSVADLDPFLGFITYVYTDRLDVTLANGFRYMNVAEQFECHDMALTIQARMVHALQRQLLLQSESTEDLFSSLFLNAVTHTAEPALFNLLLKTLFPFETNDALYEKLTDKLQARTVDSSEIATLFGAFDFEGLSDKMLAYAFNHRHICMDQLSSELLDRLTDSFEYQCQEVTALAPVVELDANITLKPGHDVAMQSALNDATPQYLKSSDTLVDSSSQINHVSPIQSTIHNQSPEHQHLLSKSSQHCDYQHLLSKSLQHCDHQHLLSKSSQHCDYQHLLSKSSQHCDHQHLLSKSSQHYDKTLIRPSDQFIHKIKEFEPSIQESPSSSPALEDSLCISLTNTPPRVLSVKNVTNLKSTVVRMHPRQLMMQESKETENGDTKRLIPVIGEHVVQEGGSRMNSIDIQRCTINCISDNDNNSMLKKDDEVQKNADVKEATTCDPIIFNQLEERLQELALQDSFSSLEIVSPSPIRVQGKTPLLFDNIKYHDHIPPETHTRSSTDIDYNTSLLDIPPSMQDIQENEYLSTPSPPPIPQDDPYHSESQNVSFVLPHPPLLIRPFSYVTKSLPALPNDTDVPDKRLTYTSDLYRVSLDTMYKASVEISRDDMRGVSRAKRLVDRVREKFRGDRN